MAGKSRIISAVLLAVAIATGSSAALAQEYGESLGDLEGVPSTVKAGDSVPFRGDGFEPGAVVDIYLVVNATGEILPLGTDTAASDGTINASVAIPNDLAPVAHTLTVAGQGVDGGNRVLSASVTIAEASTTTTDGVSTTSSPVDDEGSDPVATAGEQPDSTGILPLAIGGVVLLIAGIGGIVWWRSRATGI